MSRSAFTVALVGCDGAGKTTVAKRLEHQLGRPVRYLYMGVSADSSNRSLPTTRIAHRIKAAAGAPPDTRGPRETLEETRARDAAARKGLVKRVRKSARSTLRLTNRLAEEWYRQALASSWRRRGAIVIFDRHFIADYHAYDMSGAARTMSRRLHGFLLSRAYPKPDLVIYLDAVARGPVRPQGRGDAGVAGAAAHGVPAPRRGRRALRRRVGGDAARRRHGRGRPPRARVRRQRPPGRHERPPAA